MRRYLKFLGRTNTTAVTTLADTQAGLVIEDGVPIGIVIGDGQASPIKDLPVATLGAPFLEMPSAVMVVLSAGVDEEANESILAATVNGPNPGTQKQTFALVGFGEEDGIYRGTTKPHHVEDDTKWGTPEQIATLDRYSVIFAAATLNSEGTGLDEGLFVTLRGINGEWSTPVNLTPAP